MKRFFMNFFFVVPALFLIAKTARASEGVVELRSITQEAYRCWASSVRMQNLEFRIPFTCRNLIYPADDSVFNYILWATPKEGGETIKLGALGLGRGEFKTKTAFTNLFVTTERNKDTKTPQGRIVMRGNVESIEPFFEETLSPTPTQEPQEKVEQEKPEEPQQLTTRQKFILALKRAGIAALIALVALIGLIFVVTRSRG